MEYDAEGERSKRKRAAWTGSILNTAMIIGGAWMLFDSIGWFGALGAFLMLWGWISDTQRTSGAQLMEGIEGVAEALDDALKEAEFATSERFDDAVIPQKEDISDLEYRLAAVERWIEKGMYRD